MIILIPDVIFYAYDVLYKSLRMKDVKIIHLSKGNLSYTLCETKEEPCDEMMKFTHNKSTESIKCRKCEDPQE
jgi:hypothetical protein